MPKNPPKNAFFYYMMHYKQYEESKGRSFPGGMKEVSEKASPYWDKLSAQDRAPYEYKAKQAKKVEKPGPGVGGERYTSLGIPLSQVIREKEEREAKIRQEQDAVEKLLEICFEEGRIDTTPFFIISFNYFTKDIKGKYYPCEMGVTMFTVKDGVKIKCHSLIDPGKLPLGHAFTAKDHSEKTHMLKPPPYAIGDTDFAAILETLIDFLTTNSESMKTGKKYPLLVMEDEKETVENIMTQFCDAARFDIEKFEFLPLTYFFQKFRETCEIYYMFKSEITFSFAVASSHLERDIYQYYRGNGCPLHEEEDINIHCALSRVTRWAFTILDQTMDICEVFDKKTGLHYPLDCEIEPAVKGDNEEDGGSESDEESAVSVAASSNVSSKVVKKGPVKDEFDDVSSLASAFTNRFSLRDANDNYGNRNDDKDTQRQRSDYQDGRGGAIRKTNVGQSKFRYDANGNY